MEQEVVKKTGKHTEVTDPAVEATCTAEGKTAGSHCSVCNTVITEQQTTQKLPHDYEEEMLKEASCSETGEKKLTCKVCGDIRTEEIPMAAHTPVEDPAVEATCTAEGKTAGSHCSVCNTIIQEQKTIPSIPHTDQTQVVRALVNTNGFSRTKCTVCGHVSNESVIYSPKTLELDVERYVYNGKEAMPKVTVKDSAGKTLDAKYYTVSYQDNKKVGMAKVIVSFQDIYQGTMSETFTIVPGSAKILKLSARPKGFSVKWKKQKKEISGYLIQYSTNRKFSKKASKTVTVKKKTAASASVKKLKAKKKYFVRICTYKSVKINGKTEKICSEWSKIKTVTSKS